MDDPTKRRWLDFVITHKPTDLDFDPEVAAQMLANQEKLNRGKIKTMTIQQLLQKHFGKHMKRKK